MLLKSFLFLVKEISFKYNNKQYFASSKVIVTLFFLFIATTLPLYSKPIYVGGGIGWGDGLPGSYISTGYLNYLGLALDYKYAQQLVSGMNRTEKSTIDAYGGNPPPDKNPGLLDGGCPDANFTIPEIKASDSVKIPSQLIGVRGRGCGISSGSSSSFPLPIEGDFFFHWEFLNWMFLRSGLSFNYLPPSVVNLGLQYLGEVAGIEIQGVTKVLNGAGLDVSLNTVGTAVKVNSKATTSITGWNVLLPLMLGFNFYHDDDRAIYFAFGLALSTTSITSKLTGNQSINIIVRDDNSCGPTGIGDTPGEICNIPVNLTYNDIVNSFTAIAQPGLESVLGFRHRIKNNLFFHLELRTLTAGGIVTKKGTVKEEGKSYADITVAGLLMGLVGGAGSLNVDSANLGINLISFTNRIYFGVGSFFDTKKSNKNRDIEEEKK